jgi:hypothetical protein
VRASTSGKVELVRWVLDRGAAVDDVDDVDSHGHTALGCAAGICETRKSRWGPRPREPGSQRGTRCGASFGEGRDPATLGTSEFDQMTPLVAAPELGDVESVRHLLGHHRVDDFTDLRDWRGQTALYKASPPQANPVS